MQIAVGNGRFYGGGTVVAEHAAIDDGHLDLYSLELRTVWKLALMLRSFRSGEHGAWSEVHDGARHRVRDPHPQAARGQRRRRADRRDARRSSRSTPAR